MLNTFFLYVVSSVRVSNELGAGNPRAASFSVKIMTLMSFLISVIFGIVVILLRNVMSYVSTEGIEVADAVAKLSPFLAFSIILKASHRLSKWDNTAPPNLDGNPDGTPKNGVIN